MASSPSLHRPAPTRGIPQPLWSLTLSGYPRGLALARETGWLLVWDEKNWLYLVNRKGERQAQVPMRGTLITACCADDGTAYVAVGSRGEVWWLAPDLAPRWERSVGQRAVAAALDPFGNYLALSDASGNLHVLNRDGRLVFQVQTARPLQHLAFVPEAPLLVGSADFGLVAGFDLTGKRLWRDGLVAHCGSLATNGDGTLILLACFSEGLRCYGRDGSSQGRLPVAEPCRLAALSYDGRLILVAGLADRLILLERDGRSLCTHVLDQPVVAIALGALGDHAAVALADARVVDLDLRGVMAP